MLHWALETCDEHFFSSGFRLVMGLNNDSADSLMVPTKKALIFLANVTKTKANSASAADYFYLQDDVCETESK